MSEPTVSVSPPPIAVSSSPSSAVSSSPAPPAASVVSSASVVLLELELLPPPHPATTIARAPTRSTARRADSRVLLDKPASDQEFAGLGEHTPDFGTGVCPAGQNRAGIGHPWGGTAPRPIATLSEVRGPGKRWHQIQS